MVYFFRFLELYLLDEQNLSELGLGLIGLSIVVRSLAHMKAVNYKVAVKALPLDSQ